jgi:hypothetical protein
MNSSITKEIVVAIDFKNKNAGIEINCTSQTFTSALKAAIQSLFLFVVKN